MNIENKITIFVKNGETLEIIDNCTSKLEFKIGDKISNISKDDLSVIVNKLVYYKTCIKYENLAAVIDSITIPDPEMYDLTISCSYGTGTVHFDINDNECLLGEIEIDALITILNRFNGNLTFKTFPV